MYEIFEKLCEAKGLTPYKVSKATGIPTATLSNWKAGRYTPKQDKLQKIADFLSVSLEYLMTGLELVLMCFRKALILLDSRIFTVFAVLYIIYLCIYLHRYSVFYTVMQHGMQHGTSENGEIRIRKE